MEEEQKLRPPPERGASRLPNTGSASAYPCAEDSIARFVECGKMGESLPPGEGKKEIPRRGDGLPRRCAPRNDGELGIDFFPYHVILKIKRGAAGRREPLSSYRVTAERPSLWRLLLFNLENQRNDGYDQNTEVKEIGIRDHDITPPPM